MSEPEEKEIDVTEVFRASFSVAHAISLAASFNNPSNSVRSNEFAKPEEVLFNNKRYQECILYIQSLSNFYSDHYITYLIKANIKMGDYSSARTVTNLYMSTITSEVEKDNSLRHLNGIIGSSQADEFFMAEKLLDSSLSMQNPSYKNEQGCMIANRDIMMGETILIEEPLFSVGNSKCAQCFHDSAVRKCCEVCRSIYYCSEICRSKNKTNHQGGCNLYKHHNIIDPYTYMAYCVFLKEWKFNFQESTLFVDEVNFNNVLKQRPTYKSAIQKLLNTSRNLLAWAAISTHRVPMTIDFGGTVLKLLCFYKYKSVYIFDNALGSSNEFYSVLSNFRYSCQPNTIISRAGDKIILKASREIKKDEEIYCSYFDMLGNTTFLEVLLNNEEEVSALRENCELFCRCNKSPFNCLSTHTNSLKIDSEFKQMSAQNSRMLELIISYLKSYFKSRDSDLLYTSFYMANNGILNKNHLLLQAIHFEIIKHEITLDNFDNVPDYLPIIMNTNSIQFFKKSHMEICSALIYRTKCVFNLEKIPVSILEALIGYWKFIEEDVCPRYPNQILLDKVKTMKSYYIFTKEFHNLHEVFPLKASVA